MRAAIRPYSRLVSTRSATTTQRGGFLVSTEPGARTNFELRAPAVLASVRLPRSPMCDSSPAGSAACTRAGSAGSVVGLADADVAGDAAQLPGEVLPLADAQVVQELLAAHPPKRAAGPLLSLLAQIAPQVEDRT